MNLEYNIHEYPYMLFSGLKFYPDVPSEALIGVFETKEQAENHLKSMLETDDFNWDWAELLNLHTGEFTEYYKENF